MAPTRRSSDKKGKAEEEKGGGEVEKEEEEDGNESSSGSQTTVSSFNGNVSTVFLCRKCPGVEIPPEQRREHRQFHKNEEANDPSARTRSQRRTTEGKGPGPTRKGPGPKSKTMLRAYSPAPSSLFERVPEHKRRKIGMPGIDRTENSESELSEPEEVLVGEKRRKHKAKVLHYKGSKGMNKKYTGA